MHEDIRAARESVDDFSPPRVVEVGAKPFFVAVAPQMNGRLAMPQWRETAAVVPAIGPFNLYHIGAEVAEQLGAIGTCEVLRQVNHRQAFKRPRHPNPSCPA